MMASEMEGKVSFDELVNWTEEGDAGGTGTTGAMRGISQSHRQWMCAVHAKICNIQIGVHDINNRQIESHAKLYNKLKRVELLATRSAMAPAARRRPEAIANPGGAGTEEPATLSGCPRSLHVLWNEYETGIGGSKPAKYFTKEDRGKVKHKYSRRLVLWKAVERMIRRGADCDAAIQRIYDVYRPLHKVTAILNAMQIDERNGGHALLR